MIDYPEWYSWGVGDLVLLKDGPDRGGVGIIVHKGKVYTELLDRHYPEFDVLVDGKLLRCMSGFYLEKIG